MVKFLNKEHEHEKQNNNIINIYEPTLLFEEKAEQLKLEKKKE